LVHLPDDSDDVDDEGEKNDFAFSIKAGLSSVSMFMYVLLLLELYSGFRSLVPLERFCVRIKLILPPTIA
jgi:hypothetical protein